LEIKPRDFLRIFLRFWSFESHFLVNFFLLKKVTCSRERNLIYHQAFFTHAFCKICKPFLRSNCRKFWVITWIIILFYTSIMKRSSILLWNQRFEWSKMSWSSANEKYCMISLPTESLTWRFISSVMVVLLWLTLKTYFWLILIEAPCAIFL